MQYIAEFEQAAAREAEKWNVDGVVCGHIHHAELRFIGDVRYGYTGDWVESCTALVEYVDGRLELIFWAEIQQENTLLRGDAAKQESQSEVPIRAMQKHAVVRNIGANVSTDFQTGL